MIRSLQTGRELGEWSVWKGILKGEREVEGMGADFRNLCKRAVGLGENTSFWKDLWVGEKTFEVRLGGREGNGVGSEGGGAW